MNEDINILFLDKSNNKEDVFTNTLLEIYGSAVSYVTEENETIDTLTENPSNFHLLIIKYNQQNTQYLEFIKKVISSISSLKIVLIYNFEDKQSIFETIQTGINRVLPYPQSQEDLKINLQITMEYIEQIKKLNILNTEAFNSDKLVNEYKKAVDSSTIFSISDLKGNILYANRQFLKVSGYTLEELQGKPHSIVRHPDMEKSAFKNLWETIQDKKVWQGSVKNKRKNGEAYYVDATIVPIMDENDNIIEYAGIRYDTTELVTKTQELSEIKDKQRAKDIQKALSITIEDILEAIPFASIFVDEYSSKILSFNEDFNNMFAKHPCFRIDEYTLEHLFIKEEPYLQHDPNFSFFDCYELSEEDDRVVAINMNDTIYEFFVGITQKDNGLIISLVEKR